MNPCGAALAGFLFVGGFSAAQAGHTLGHYPSYYPDEIVVDTVAPAAAGKELADETLQAYVGAAPVFADGIPGHVKTITSLAAVLVLGLDPALPAYATRERRCAAARSIMAALAEAKTPGFVFHPYPVTPYHPDYVHHADLAEAATAAVRGGVGPTAGVKIDAKGQLAQAIAGAHRSNTAGDTSVSLEEVPADSLAAGAAAVQLDGWLGPPWAKQGWSQAYRFLSPSLDDASRRFADGIHQRLTRGEVSGPVEEAEMERRLVAALTQDCRRLVAGYALRREYVNESASAGMENAAYDSLAGLNTPVFLRTAKLKDFPWNGRLRLGLREGSRAAWNPVAGFTDAAGRLIWSALGDPAMLPIPYNAGWAPNRAQFEVRSVHGQSGGIRLPGDALIPELGTGALQPVAARTFGSVKATYESVGSPYLDGTAMAMADVVYPFAFAYRWGAAAEPDAKPREPALAAAVGAMRDRLVGFRPVRMRRDLQNIAEGLNVVHLTPVVEVYLKDAPGGGDQAAAVAPPWGAVPWHLLALMEAAVDRAYAAFSQDEASRRGVPWLDLARDPALREKLLALCAEFERTRFRPAALERFVTLDEAALRWRALHEFAETNGHFLVTNGPYRMKSWGTGSVALAAVREATYPLGFGTFDHLANPPRAAIREVTREPGTIMVRADADMTVKVLRRQEVRREPLTRSTAQGTRGILVASRYVLIAPGGAVAAAGKMSWEPDNRFKIALPEGLPAGRYAAAVGVFLDGNTLPPSVKVFSFEVDGKN